MISHLPFDMLCYFIERIMIPRNMQLYESLCDNKPTSPPTIGYSPKWICGSEDRARYDGISTR